MKRLFALMTALLLLTACSTAKEAEPSSGGPSNGNLKTFGPRPASQSPAPKPVEQSATPSESATGQKTVPAAVLQSPAPAAPATESPCTWPTPATLQAKGTLLLADGQISFYKMAWGTNCATYVDPHDTWVVQGNGTPMPLIREIKKFQGVQAVALPGGEHGYLVDGGATGAASSSYYLMVFRNGGQRLVGFVDGSGHSQEAISSTGFPEVQGDQISVAERVGTGTEMHYNLKTWKLDAQYLMATMVSESESYPSKLP